MLNAIKLSEDSGSDGNANPLGNGKTDNDTNATTTVDTVMTSATKQPDENHAVMTNSSSVSKGPETVSHAGDTVPDMHGNNGVDDKHNDRDGMYCIGHVTV